jgi:hypothetical protein
MVLASPLGHDSERIRRRDKAGAVGARGCGANTMATWVREQGDGPAGIGLGVWAAEWRGAAVHFSAWGLAG